MSTMSSFGNALDRYPGAASDSPARRFLTAVDTFWSGAADGLAADRAYHELVRLGAPHEKAVETVLDRHLRAR